MPLRPEDLSSDPAHLTEMLLASEAENARLRATIVQLKGMIFGSRSERRVTLIAEQLPLDLDDRTPGSTAEILAPESANDDQSNKGGSSDKPGGKRNRIIGALPKHLPRVDLLIEPETTSCPCCAGQLHRIGEDVSETLDRIPAVLRVLRTIRPKYACRTCEEAIVQAKAPARLIEGGMVSTALVSHIAVAKYGWHSTLYRQMQILAGQGVLVDRQTLGRWMKRLAWWLKGLYELQLRVMHANPRLFCDETPIRVLEPGRGRSKICQFWAHAVDDRPWNGPAPPAVAYVFAPSRGKKEIATQLTNFSGILQVDAYAAYKAIEKDSRISGKIELAFCLAHARRKFVAVFKTTQSPVAKEVIEQIAVIYGIEAKIRGMEAERRRAFRQLNSRPVMEALKARLLAVKDGLSRQSPLTTAIDYTLNHWTGLTLFLADGRLEPDTNIVERSIRPVALGRKNALFCGDEGGGETWAILASLINTAKLNGLDPETWLTNVLERIVSGATKNDQLHELLAWNWKAAREAETNKAAA